MKILFIVLGILLVLAILTFFFLPIILKNYQKKNYISYYGRKIYRIANENDYYLINKVKLESSARTTINVNHLLFGNKYIYVITDYYIEGNLSAKEDDNAWIVKPSNKKQNSYYVDNLVLKCEELTTILSRITNLNRDLFIPIALINSNCEVSNYEPKSKDHFLVHISHLSKLIKTVEKREVAKLNEKQLYYAVRDIARLNLNNK